MMLKIAWKHIKSRPFSGLLTVIGCSLVLTLLGSFWTLKENLELAQKTAQPERQSNVSVFLQSSSAKNDIQRVRAKMKASQFFSKVELLSSQAALSEFRSEFGETLSKAVDEKVIPHVLKAELKEGAINRDKFSSHVNTLRRDAAVLEVDSGGALAARVTEEKPTEDRIINWAQVLFVIVFAIVALLISHLIRLVFESSRNEIDTMKILGASGHHIFLPLLLEGLFYGLLSSLLSILLLFVCVNSLLPELASYLLPKNYEIFFLSARSWLGIVGVALTASILGALFTLPLLNRPATKG